MSLDVNRVNASPEIEEGSERLHLQRLADLHAIQQLAAIYPILVAFEGAGWLTSRQEEVDPHAEGRPRRRYYRLTAAGATEGRAAVAAREQRAGRGGVRRLAW